MAIESSMSIRGKMETDLAVVGSGRNYEVMLQALPVAVKHGIDSGI
jgi:hypothetical protein